MHTLLPQDHQDGTKFQKLIYFFSDISILTSVLFQQSKLALLIFLSHELYMTFGFLIAKKWIYIKYQGLNRSFNVLFHNNIRHTINFVLIKQRYSYIYHSYYERLYELKCSLCFTGYPVLVQIQV